jgi:hypothetical protein
MAASRGLNLGENGAWGQGDLQGGRSTTKQVQREMPNRKAGKQENRKKTRRKRK